MRIEAFPDTNAAAAGAADFIATCAVTTARERGRFIFAVSGGHTPWIMLRALAKKPLPWERIEIFQVDERIAPAGDPDRNLTHLQASLLDHCPLRLDQIHAMPVDDKDLAAAARRYADGLRDYAGAPPVLDLIHLGLGPDGHTASLIPWDPVLEIDDRDIALTEVYQGHRRMTMTYPVLNRARSILWLVTGDEKAGMLSQLVQGDRSIPAGRVAQNQATVVADRGAVLQLSPHDVVMVG
jgi:6-phosphogluconolactonase